MKAAFFALAPLSFLIVVAALYSSTGDAAQMSAAPLADMRDNDTLTIVFVEGAEAEPPALPEGLTVPVAESAPAAKAITYVTPETVKRLPGIRRVHARTSYDGTIDFDIPPAPGSEPKFKRPVFHYNE